MGFGDKRAMASDCMIETGLRAQEEEERPCARSRGRRTRGASVPPPMRSAFLMTLPLFCFGCAHYWMACPVDGGPKWIEVTSTHFDLRTDLPAADAEKVVTDAEAM